MDSNLKTSSRFFQVCALVSEIKSVKSNFGEFFGFQNSFDFASLAA